MKYRKYLIVSTVILSVIINVSPAYATSVIASSGLRNINISNIFVLNSTGNVNKLDDKKEFFAITDSSTTKFVKVFKSSKVYTSSNKNSKIIGTLDTGSMVVIGDEVDGFSQIFYTGNIGYVNSSNLKETSAKEIQTDTNKSTENITHIAIISNDSTPLKKEMDGYSSTVGIVNKDIHLDVIEVYGEWIKVSYNNKICYVSTSNVIIEDKQDKDDKIVRSDNIANDIVDYAKRFLGKPYIYGGIDLDIGTDCSGFTKGVFEKFNIKINRISRDQILNGNNIRKSELKKGDLIFFNSGGNSPISHAGIYIGNDEYIHSTPTNNKGVMISNINDSYSIKNYYGATRVIDN